MTWYEWRNRKMWGQHKAGKNGIWLAIYWRISKSSVSRILKQERINHEQGKVIK